MADSAFSVVKSQAIPKRRPSLQENLLSYESRNYNYTTCDRYSGAQEFGEAMAMNALRRAFDLEKLAELRDSIIAITNKGIREWLSKREPSQIKALEKDLEKPLNLEEEIIKFKLMVKRAFLTVSVSLHFSVSSLQIFSFSPAFALERLSFVPSIPRSTFRRSSPLQ
jgi:hypothetical protein